MVSQMIKDEKTRKRLEDEWRSVCLLQSKIKTALLGGFATGGKLAIFAADAAHNLPLIHAFAVLNNVLVAFRDQGTLSCSSDYLKSLLKASKGKLAWVDYDEIKNGVERRNDVAHRSEVLPRVDCWKLIDAIEIELKEWGIVGEGPRPTVTMSVRGVSR